MDKIAIKTHLYVANDWEQPNQIDLRFETAHNVALHEFIHAVFGGEHTLEGFMNAYGDPRVDSWAKFRWCDSDGCYEWKAWRYIMRRIDDAVYSVYGNPRLVDGMSISAAQRVIL